MKCIFDTSKKATWLLLIVMLLLTGCGNASTDEPSVEGNSREEIVPTMPSANFTSVGAQSGLTKTTELATPTAVADEGPDLAMGERVYTNRCAECHGGQADGGSATALAGLEMSEDDFEDLVRTGGELGSEHLFGTRAVSDNGLFAIYAWLQSLSE